MSITYWTSVYRLSLDKGDIEVVEAADVEEVLLMGALSAKWSNNDAIDKALTAPHLAKWIADRRLLCPLKCDESSRHDSVIHEKRTCDFSQSINVHQMGSFKFKLIF